MVWARPMLKKCSNDWDDLMTRVNGFAFVLNHGERAICACIRLYSNKPKGE